MTLSIEEQKLLDKSYIRKCCGVTAVIVLGFIGVLIPSFWIGVGLIISGLATFFYLESIQLRDERKVFGNDWMRD